MNTPEEPNQRAFEAQILNTLLTRANDAAEGYLQASELIHTGGIKDFMTNAAISRGLFANQICSMILELGQQADDSGSVAGKAHIAWMKIREAINISDGKIIVLECIRGEELSLKDYEQAISEPQLSDKVKVTLLEQQNHLLKDLDSLHAIAKTIAC